MKFQTYISVMSLNEIRIVDQISKSLNITHKRIDSAIKLLGEGNTIPFIARYRKEVTDSLNETNYVIFKESIQDLLILLIGEIRSLN